MKVFIGGAWPYANGSLHIGHIAALLPGDVLARYFRLKGFEVCYAAGSDCHGTPIEIRAGREGVLPEEIANRYHDEFMDCFNKLGFTYDIYAKTNDSHHIYFVQQFFKELLKSGYIYSKSIEQVFCTVCNKFLPDRFVAGKCPNCGNSAKGDQCDSCGSLLDSSYLNEKLCGICGETPIYKESEHLFLALSKLEHFIKEYVDGCSSGWRNNAVGLSRRYIDEGFPDRAVTRDLEWGISVPVEGFENKKIYVWVDAVLGYLSASKNWAETSGVSWEALWGESSVHYYVHGKDNIPFHTIILPALLKANGDLHLPDRIVSSEYLTLEGKKISTSQEWAIWIPDIIQRYNPDTVRYFLIANGPEKRDTDFSWREFINSHNGELLGTYGNFVNRSLVFIQKSYDGEVPEGQCDLKIKGSLHDLYKIVGDLIEQGNFKDALESIFSFIRSANKYFDEERPWITVKEDLEKCRNTLYTCVQIIANISVLLSPFLPNTSSQVYLILKIESVDWSYKHIPPGVKLGPVKILFERIEKERIDEEMKKLLNK
ncbi:MAG TPA: methionine--tRNA ligase [Pseudobacteroides sp.]|uniref:methionine--tRNA ligase n=1 Tax=Pseudobacteroides sp. TaxID=1968840 RepID=UPI002F946096